jgi:hypothetical protein
LWKESVATNIKSAAEAEDRRRNEALHAPTVTYAYLQMARMQAKGVLDHAVAATAAASASGPGGANGCGRRHSCAIRWKCLRWADAMSLTGARADHSVPRR